MFGDVSYVSESPMLLPANWR